MPGQDEDQFLVNMSRLQDALRFTQSEVRIYSRTFSFECSNFFSCFVMKLNMIRFETLISFFS